MFCVCILIWRNTLVTTSQMAYRGPYSIIILKRMPIRGNGALRPVWGVVLMDSAADLHSKTHTIDVHQKQAIKCSVLSSSRCSASYNELHRKAWHSLHRLLPPVWSCNCASQPKVTLQRDSGVMGTSCLTPLSPPLCQHCVMYPEQFLLFYWSGQTQS